MSRETRTAGSAKGIVQRAMESKAIVSIYESRLWRRSPFVEAVMGITFERELDCVARAARIDKARRVLDLACGSGIYTRPFARRMKAGRVIGLDISRPMLAHAQRKRREAGLHNIDWIRGSALAIPFRTGSFDVVNCCAALHLLPEPAQALAETHRVLAAGGRFTAAVLRARDGVLGRGQAQLRRRFLGLHSFTRDNLGRMLQRAGFTQYEVHHAAGIWMVASAVKPRRRRSGVRKGGSRARPGADRRESPPAPV